MKISKKDKNLLTLEEFKFKYKLFNLSQIDLNL